VLHPQSQTFAPANDVSFVISTDSTSAASEEINVKYQITNVSNGSLYVPRNPNVNGCLVVGPLHINVWLEDSKGKHFYPGWLSDCLSGGPRLLGERLSKTAILLKPRESTDGKLSFDPRLFKLPPGDYRVEAVLSGWRDDEFSRADLTSLAKWDAPLLRGETPASTRITLTP